MNPTDEKKDSNNNPFSEETRFKANYSLHHLRFPSIYRTISFFSQWLSLVLIASMYQQILVTEKRTFGWRGVLDTFGISVKLTSGSHGTECSYQNHQIHWPFVALFWYYVNQILSFANSENEGGNLSPPHSIQCEYTLEVNHRFWWNLWIVGGATVINFLTSSFSRKITDVKTLKFVTAACFLYPLTCIYLLQRILMNLNNDYQTLQSEMSYECNGRSVFSDAISQWWIKTQRQSQCCGVNSPLDWNMARVNRFDLYEYYHGSCARNSFTEVPASLAINLRKMLFGLTGPTIDEVWHEGCLSKEQDKMLMYGINILTLLIVHSVTGTVLILHKVFEAVQENIHKIKSTDFNFHSEKLKNKVFINVQGLGNPNFNLLCEKKDAEVSFSIHLTNLPPLQRKDFLTTESRGPFLSLGILFYSQFLLEVYALDGKKIAKVHIKSTEAVMRKIKAYVDDELRYVVEFGSE